MSITSAGSRLPCSTSESACSIRAVSSTSFSRGSTTSVRRSPSVVACNCRPLRSTSLERTSFSMVSARVAGVPMPPECDSSSSSAALRFLSSTHRLACSIAASSVASVNGLGGRVSPSSTVTFPTGRMTPPSMRFDGITFLPPAGFAVSSSSGSGPWPVSTAFHPADTVSSERLENSLSVSSESRAFTSVTMCTWSSPTASHMRRTMRVITLRSSSSRPSSFPASNCMVGRIAVWPATFASLTASSGRGCPGMPSRVTNPWARRPDSRSAVSVSRSSCVMYRLSVRG